MDQARACSWSLEQLASSRRTRCVARSSIDDLPGYRCTPSAQSVLCACSRASTAACPPCAQGKQGAAAPSIESSEVCVVLMGMRRLAGMGLRCLGDGRCAGIVTTPLYRTGGGGGRGREGKRDPEQLVRPGYALGNFASAVIVLSRHHPLGEALAPSTSSQRLQWRR